MKFCFADLIDYEPGLQSRSLCLSRSPKESDVFWWRQCRIRIFLYDFDSGSPIGSHHTPKLGIPVEMVQFLLQLC